MAGGESRIKAAKLSRAVAQRRRAR